MKRIAIYSRKSVFDDKSNSTSNQIKMVKDYFNRQSECEYSVFEDEGFSGGNTNRPDFQRMMQQVQINSFDIIAVYKIDRIARNIVDFVNIYDELHRRNIALVSITEAFDATSPMGKLIMMILATFAEMERENIKQRIKDNKVEASKSGKWNGGAAPLGFKIATIEENGKKGKYLEINESQTPIVLDIFNKMLEINNISQVSKYCKEKYGILGTVSALRQALTSPMYVMANNEVLNFLKRNNEVYGYIEGNGYNTYAVKVDRTKKFYSAAKHKGVIEPDIWLKLQYMIQTRKVAQKVYSETTFLSGLVRCSKCGSKMWVLSSKSRGKQCYTFTCSNRMKKLCDNKGVVVKRLENMLLNDLHNLTISKDEFLKSLNTDNKSSDTEGKIKSVNKTIDKKSKEIEKLISQMLKVSGPALDMVTNKMNLLSEEIKQLKEELFILEKSKTFDYNQVQSYEYLFDQVVIFLNIFNEIDFEDKKKILSSFIEYIEWDGASQSINIVM